MKKVVVEAFRAFFDVRDGEKTVSKVVAKRAAVLTTSRVVFGWFDWFVSGALASFSFWMQANGASNQEVFLGTWLYDFFASALFFFVSDMTGVDFTLGQSLRRMSDSFANEGFIGKIFSGIFLFFFSVKAIIWEGPEVICFLFQKELKTKRNVWLGLFALSAVQGVFGTWLYTTGYRLWQKYVPSELGTHYVLLGIATFVIFVIVVVVLKKLWQWTVALVKVLAEFIRYLPDLPKSQKIIISVQMAILLAVVIMVWVKW